MSSLVKFFFNFTTIYRMTNMNNSKVYFQFHLYNIVYHQIKIVQISLHVEDTLHD